MHRSSDSSSLSTSWYVGFVSVCFVALFTSLFILKTASGDGFNQMAVYLFFFGAVPFVAAWAAYRGTLDANSFSKHAGRNRWMEHLGHYLPIAVLLYGLWGACQEFCV